MTDIFAGGCACGAVRYEMHARPLFVHCCHCTDCQRQTGSAFAVNALIEAGHVQLTSGAVAATSLPTDSGRALDEYRCSVCHTAVWSDYGRRGYLIFLHTGTLDAPDSFAPDVHIFTRSKRSWVLLGDGAPVFEEFYDMKALWPAASLERRKAASEAAKG